MMKFNSIKCKVMKMEHSKGSDYDHHLVGHNLQESICKGDLRVDTVTSLSPEHHIKRNVKEKQRIQGIHKQLVTLPKKHIDQLQKVQERSCLK